jgi:hypothetical protein
MDPQPGAGAERRGLTLVNTRINSKLLEYPGARANPAGSGRFIAATLQ